MNRHTFAICAYKESPYLEKCIKSLLKQSEESCVIMITSTPNPYIQGMAEKYSIPLYINENGGITQDWNFAYEKAETDYVTITHQDDVYSPDYAKCVLSDLNKTKDPIIWFSNYAEVRNGQIVKNNKLLRVKRIMLMPLKVKAFQGIRFIRRRILSLGCPICCPSVTLCKRKIKSAPFEAGFRSDEDWQAWEKLSLLKGYFVYNDKILMGHRIHEESETSNILQDNARSKEDYIMFKKFWPDRIARVLTKVYSKSEDSNQL